VPTTMQQEKLILIYGEKPCCMGVVKLEGLHAIMLRTVYENERCQKNSQTGKLFPPCGKNLSYQFMIELMIFFYARPSHHPCRQRAQRKVLCVFVGWAGFFAHVFVNGVAAWAKKPAHPTRMLQTHCCPVNFHSNAI